MKSKIVEKHTGEKKIAAQTQCKEKSPCVMRFTETMAQIGKVCVSVLDSISLLSNSATLALMCPIRRHKTLTGEFLGLLH